MSTDTTATVSKPRLRRADLASILTGLVLFLFGGAYLLASGDHLRVNAGWSVSLLAIGLGLCGVLGSVLGVRRR